MKVGSFYSIVGTFMSAIVAYFVVNDSSAWTIKSSFDLYLIIATVRTKTKELIDVDDIDMINLLLRK